MLPERSLHALPRRSCDWRTTMNNDTRTEHVTRESILMLLSDDEVASVSTAETRDRPLEGEEYIDLEDLDRGVRSALGATPGMGRLLLRRAVHENTWKKILEQLAVLHTAKAHPGA
jgi:hypothetical protein